MLLEDVTLGGCNKCEHRYYPLQLLKAVEALVTGKKRPQVREVPVLHG